MAIANKPYAVSAQVGLLIPNLLNNKLDFDENTTPRKSAVDQYLVWTANQIDLQFQQAGYVIPFIEDSDYPWSDEQNYYLELLNALGAAAYAGGMVLKPAPAISVGRGVSAGNTYQEMFNLELRKIWDGKTSQIRFKAKTYAGTPAEYSIREPIGPNLDYIAGKMNPEDFFSFQTYTELKFNIQTYIENYSPINWGNFHSLVNNKLYGYSYAG